MSESGSATESEPEFMSMGDSNEPPKSTEYESTGRAMSVAEEVCSNIQTMLDNFVKKTNGFTSEGFVIEPICDCKATVMEVLFGGKRVLVLKIMVNDRVGFENELTAMETRLPSLKCIDSYRNDDTGVYVLMMEHGGKDALRISRNGLVRRTWPSLAVFLVDFVDRFHSFGFAHRDIKPDNVVWDEKRWHLVDFGISERIGKESVTGSAGTVGFIPPGHLDVRIGDQYAAALTILFVYNPLLISSCCADCADKRTCPNERCTGSLVRVDLMEICFVRDRAKKQSHNKFDALLSSICDVILFRHMNVGFRYLLNGPGRFDGPRYCPEHNKNSRTFGLDSSLWEYKGRLDNPWIDVQERVKYID
jgi:serine/threonine protein kinase